MVSVLSYLVGSFILGATSCVAPFHASFCMRSSSVRSSGWSLLFLAVTWRMLYWILAFFGFTNECAQRETVGIELWPIGQLSISFDTPLNENFVISNLESLQSPARGQSDRPVSRPEQKSNKSVSEVSGKQKKVSTRQIKRTELAHLHRQVFRLSVTFQLLSVHSSKAYLTCFKYTCWLRWLLFPVFWGARGR